MSVLSLKTRLCRDGSRLACFCLLGFVLTACATTGVDRANIIDEELPSRWEASVFQNGEVEDHWWTSFDDPRLMALIEEALAQNPSVLTSDAQARQSRAQAGIIKADRLPQIGASFNGLRSKQSSAAFAGIPGLPADAFSDPQDNFTLQSNINWEIDLWGRLGNLNEAARTDYLASEANRRAVRQSIAGQVIKAYFALIEAQEQADLAERTAGSFEESTRQISNRADVGVVSPADKELAIANLENAKAGLAQARISLEQASRALQLLLRDYPSGDIEVADALPDLPSISGIGLPAELLARRPDVLAAERGLYSAGLRATASRKAFLPAISLTGSAGTQSTEFENLLDGDFSVWSIAGQVVQPIFQGGRIKANINLTDARVEEAAQNYAQTALQAFSEVETAMASEQYLIDREASLLRASNAASEAERISDNRYAQGLTPYVTVLEAQSRALDTRSAYLSARRARLENRVNLHLALGGGFNALDPVTAKTAAASKENTQ